VLALKYFAIVLRDKPVRSEISRIESFSRKDTRRIMFKSPQCITPLLPVARGAGGRVTWLNSQWKLLAFPAHFRMEINSLRSHLIHEGQIKRTKTPISKASAEQIVKDIHRAPRRHYSAEDKIRIVLEGLPGEDCFAQALPRRNALPKASIGPERKIF